MTNNFNIRTFTITTIKCNKLLKKSCQGLFFINSVAAYCIAYKINIISFIIHERLKWARTHGVLDTLILMKTKFITFNKTIRFLSVSSTQTRRRPTSSIWIYIAMQQIKIDSRNTANENPGVLFLKLLISDSNILIII